MRRSQEDAGYEASSRRDVVLEELSSIENALAEVEKEVQEREKTRVTATCALKHVEGEAKKAQSQQKLHASTAATSRESLRARQIRIEEVRGRKATASTTRCCIGNRTRYTAECTRWNGELPSCQGDKTFGSE